MEIQKWVVARWSACLPEGTEAMGDKVVFRALKFDPSNHQISLRVTSVPKRHCTHI